MAMEMNEVRVVGHLTRDPEMRYTPKGTAIANATVAVNERYTTADGEQKTQVAFIDVTAWGKSAENLSKLATKGKEIFVEGSLRQENWQDKDTGKNRSKIMINSDRWQFTQYLAKEAPERVQNAGVER